jgi:hypothetical protein
MPVVCEKLVYLQLQKTACSRIGAILIDLFGGTQVFPKHALLPDPATSKCIVGSVRNPWDSYVSLWAFGGQGEGQLHRRLTQRRLKHAAHQLPSPGFLLGELTRPMAPWRRLYAAPHTPEQFRSWLARVHAPSHGRELDKVYGRSQVRHFAGLATYRYCRLYAGDLRGVLDSSTTAELDSRLEANYLPDAMIRMEYLADDLIAAVKLAGYAIDSGMEHEIRTRARVRTNTSEHRPYVDFYDDASRDLVGRRDASIITKHGYHFGS